MYRLLTNTILLVFCFQLSAQEHSGQIYVDPQGVMRWSEDHSELYGFGVNYTLPFAHEYRMALKSGVNPEEAIRQDVYHMARLDLDLYRVHVWDTEISDTLGNLLDNEHLRLFDFAVHEMQQRGIRIFITPIAYWGNGWPEADEKTPGYSFKYGKSDCLTNPAAIAAQANYLYQFLSHVNPYTGLAYKDDPRIIGFEICNEPHHQGTETQVISFINRMVASIRQTGCTKPVFYNMSHSIHLSRAYLKADIQGGTFQWYPTNLVANHQINGNFLPQVDQYPIPFAGDTLFKKMAKVIYEFDPADAGGNILYTAMARTFRESGMQLAAQFDYDAMCWAPYNTNYGTHFMNLAYTPQKAISLKIASAVFHQVPLYQAHPDRQNFSGFHISYEDDLAEFVSEDKFFYSNNTVTKPNREDKLNEIAGYGSSPLVSYDGRGAYFLDKLEDGIWRLEIMPDAFWIRDPYSKVSPRVQKAAVFHSLHHIEISLANLGKDFGACPVNAGNNFVPKVLDTKLDLVPGVYILKRKGLVKDIAPNSSFKNFRIAEYVAPADNLREVILQDHTIPEMVAGSEQKVDFEVFSPKLPVKSEVLISDGRQWKILKEYKMVQNHYLFTIPSELTDIGFIKYRILVVTGQDTFTYPGGKAGDPRKWDNHQEETYTIKVVPAHARICLWSADQDWEQSYRIWNPSVKLVPGLDGTTRLQLKMKELPRLIQSDTLHEVYAFKFYFGGKLRGRLREISGKEYLVLKANNDLQVDQSLEIGIGDNQGNVVSHIISIGSGEQQIRIPLKYFGKGKYLILPRPFPEFLPLYENSGVKSFDWAATETLQVEVRENKTREVSLNIESIWLE